MIVDPLPVYSLILQMVGALYFAFAMMNWTAKESLIGGIYGRPIVIGNLTHFVIGALALIKSAAVQPPIPVLWIAVLIYSFFAAAFSFLFFRHPGGK